MYVKKSALEKGRVEIHVEVPIEDHRTIRTVAAATGRNMRDVIVPVIVAHCRAEAARLGLDQLQAPAAVA